MDKLEKQLNAEEFNEEIAMVVFKVKNQNILISLMDSIENAIAERGLYKKAHDSRVNERTMQTHEGMIHKDALEIDNNVAGASHAKDNITEVQSSKHKMFENFFAHDHDKAHDHEKTKTDHKMLKEENVLLKKEIETYKERVRDFNEKQYIKNLEQEKEELQDQLYRENKQKIGLGYTDPCPLGQAIACHPRLYDVDVLGLHYVKPDVHDTVEILNDAAESQVKMKEKQFQFNYENINSLYDTFVPQTELSLEQEYFSNPSTSNVSSELSLDESDVPPKEM
ncbi:hypothetical protein Tco_0553764, partial [Tanacetum coccineum]